MTIGKNTEVFFSLLQSGLWERETQFLTDDDVDFSEIYRFAKEQAVLGLIASGIEWGKSFRFPKKEVLTFVGSALQIEQRNMAMNSFIACLVDKMSSADIYTLLVKGQGIAQCYERPLWRASGDVDFFLSDSNYDKAKSFLIPLASYIENEEQYGKHLGMTIDGWTVELHGTLRCGLSRRMDKVIDEAQDSVFYGGNVRSWLNGHTKVPLPGHDDDVIFVFTHYIKHFYKEGIGLRQICDWCRLLWIYRDTINVPLLEKRLCSARLMTEWRAFAAFSVSYLGMPDEAMPLYDSSIYWNRKAKRICSYIMDVGNVGDNEATLTFGRKPYLIRKVLSLCCKCRNLMKIAVIFPKNTILFFPYIVFNGVRSVLRGE